VRKIINTLIAIVIILGAVLYANHLVSSNNRVKPPAKKVVKTVFAETAQNGPVPISINTNGLLMAKNRFELFAEVQGILKNGSLEFKPGQIFKKGDLLINIDAQEFRASLVSSRSNFQNTIAGMMADLKLDYPNAYNQWNDFLQRFDLEKPLPALPEINDKKAELFIAGRGVTSAYYAIKNLEERLVKYSIRAPYDGVLASASVTEGTLVRPGQNLGEFIATDVYELMLSIAPEASDYLNIGDVVSLRARAGDRTFKGAVTRINKRVDPTTQMVQVFVETRDPSLKEGMYLEAEINAGSVDDAILMSRKLLVDESSIYAVKDGLLVLLEVRPVYFMPNKMVVRGIPNGSMVLTQPVAGAHSGMMVQIFDAQEGLDNDENISQPQEASTEN